MNYQKVGEFFIHKVNEKQLKKAILFEVNVLNDLNRYSIIVSAKDKRLSSVSSCYDINTDIEEHLEVLFEQYVQDDIKNLTQDAVEFRQALSEYFKPLQITDSYVTTKGYIRFTCPYCGKKIDVIKTPKFCPECGNAFDLRKE